MSEKIEAKRSRRKSKIFFLVMKSFYFLPLKVSALIFGLYSVVSATYTKSFAEDQNKSSSSLDPIAELRGPDTNDNGIRDDVEDYIAKNYTVPAQRRAVEQLARVIQSQILIEKSNNEDGLKQLSLKSSKAINCLYSQYKGAVGETHPAATISKIESLTTNTKQRMKAYLAFSKAVSGTWGSVPEGDTCE